MPQQVKPNSFAAWMACMRPKTWTIAVAPVAVGLSFALTSGINFDWRTAIATCLLSVCMQVISNMENDSGYTKRKAEKSNRKGLPRATSNNWLTVNAVENGIKVVALVAILDTAYLIYIGGWVMAFITLASIVAGYCYMGGPRPIAYSPFGELTVFVFFGLVAVCGTYYLQTKTLCADIFVPASSLGLIAAAVLAVNNYRDREHDASIGRKTLSVMLGKQGTLNVLKGALVAPYFLIAGWVAFTPKYLPVLMTLVSIPLIFLIMKNIRKKQGVELNSVMFLTIKLELIFSALMTIGALASYFLTD